MWFRYGSCGRLCFPNEFKALLRQRHQSIMFEVCFLWQTPLPCRIKGPISFLTIKRYHCGMCLRYASCGTFRFPNEFKALPRQWRHSTKYMRYTFYGRLLFPNKLKAFHANDHVRFGDWWSLILRYQHKRYSLQLIATAAQASGTYEITLSRSRLLQTLRTTIQEFSNPKFTCNNGILFVMTKY